MKLGKNVVKSLIGNKVIDIYCNSESEYEHIIIETEVGKITFIYNPYTKELEIF